MLDMFRYKEAGTLMKLSFALLPVKLQQGADAADILYVLSFFTHKIRHVSILK